VKRLCLLAVLAGLLVTAPPAAAAFTAPELFVRQQAWDSHDDTGPWLPLVGAPAIDFLGGYEIGTRMQDSGEPHNLQRMTLQVTGVPDGAPTQPSNPSPYCVTRATDPPGTIVPAGPELQFEGDGTYTVKVSIGAGTGDGDDCLAGPSRSGSFSVGVLVAPVLVGEPMTFRLKPVPSTGFVGVKAAAPPGGLGDVQCRLGALVVPAADEPSDFVSEDDFLRPGGWSCVARGTARGQDDNLDSVVFGTPWSAPLAVPVRTDFRRAKGRISRARTKRPRLTFGAEWPDLVAGASASVKLSRVAGCKGKKYKLRSTRRYRGRFGPKSLRVTIRRPRKTGFYYGSVTFKGSPYVRAGVDPYPLLLTKTRKKRVGFADPQAFPACPGYKP
jgi:hypothetical protein